MTMTDREWGTILEMKKTIENLALRFVVIEDQYNRDKKFRWLLITTMVGLVVWKITGK